MARARRLSLIALAALALAGCGGGDGDGTTSEAAAETSSSGCRIVEAPEPENRSEPKPTQRLDATKTYDVTIATNCGSFTIRLDQKTSPATSASFATLARKKYFDGTIFHRIVPGFVIQGGDPTASGTGGPGYTTVDRPPAGARYTHGVVAMAKSPADPPGTAGSQFFVVTGEDAQLPPEYAILGKVVKGLDVVDRIAALGDPATEQPTEVVQIGHARVHVS